MDNGCGDGFLGPSVFTPACRGGFDFTLLFEESILTLAPTACFLLLASARAVYLWGAQQRVQKTPIYGAKLVVTALFSALQIASLVLVATTPTLRERVAIATATLNVLVGPAVVALSHLEHLKSVRPSFLLTAYLSISLLLDVIHVRTEWLLGSNTAIASILTALITVKFLWLALETVEKRRLLRQDEKGLSFESTSGPFNRGFFIWLNGFLWTGFATLFSYDSLPSISEKLAADKVHDRFHRAWTTSGKRKGKYRLLTVTLDCLKCEIVTIALPRLALVGLHISQPFLIANAVMFVENRNISMNTGYGLIGAFALVFISAAVTRSWYEHLGFRAMALLRSGLISLIYDKMMQLPSSQASESGAMSIMGADVETLAESFHSMICDSWADLLQLSIATWLLANQLGAVCVAPIIIAIAFTSTSFGIGTRVTKQQKIWLESIQKRINFTSEILGSINSVKMLGLTEKMTEMIKQMRTDEISAMKMSRRWSGFNTCLINTPDFLGQFFTFAAYAIAAKLQGNAPLSINQAVTSLSLLNLLISPLQSLLMTVPQSFTSMGCMQRIQEFLTQHPHVERRIVTSNERPASSRPSVNMPGLERGTGVELRPMSQTTAAIAGVAAVAAETPTISLRDCSFGWDSSARSHRPRTTTTLGNSSPGGSLTMVVGPVGCGKSTFLKALIGETSEIGGELHVQTRRMAYCDQTSWIINGTIRDNIIAGTAHVDEDWYAAVLGACDLNADLQQLRGGDLTVVGSKGVKLSGGQKQRIAIARAAYARPRIAIFDDVFSGLDAVTEQVVFDRVFGRHGLLRRCWCTAVLSTHRTQYLSEADDIIALGMNGEIVEKGSFAHLQQSGGYIHSLELTAENANGVGPTSHEPEVNMERQVSRTAKEPEDVGQTTDLAIWKYYLSALGRLPLGLFVVFLAINSGFNAFRFVWITWWAQSDTATTQPTHSLGYWLGIYSLVGLLGTAGMVSATFFMYLVVVPRTAGRLHDVVLSTVMRAPMSFLSNTETGLLVNRFSQDMRLVDNTLPRSFVGGSFMAMGSVSQAGLAIAAVSYVAASIPLLLVALWLIQRFYLRTSRQLRLLEIESKAPLFSHFIESLGGLTTIRSFGWTHQYFQKTIGLINVAQKPYYLLLCIQRWLVCVLDLLVAGLTILLVSLAVSLRSQIDPGLLGVALVMMMSLGEQLASFVQLWTQVETSLGAIARIRSFQEDTPSEFLPMETTDPGAVWPKDGGVRFDNVSLSYSSSPVVHNVSFTISPGQKFGLVGRTGSGKSSIALSLLRMVDISAGSVTVDGEDLATLPRATIRKQLSCLTQEPFLFTRTVRLNADPLGENLDVDITSALERVGLWQVISSKVSPGGESPPGLDPLDATMDENFLSYGQRQLFCLARALLKKSSVLILDEPTSSVDSHTNAQMQAVIRSEFSHCTIIMITHLLDTVLDFDLVAVLDKGHLLEFGNPRELLHSQASAFSRMYRRIR